MSPHHRQIDASEHGVFVRPSSSFAANKVFGHRDMKESQAKWVDEQAG
jgi:hypothetical protein